LDVRLGSLADISHPIRDVRLRLLQERLASSFATVAIDWPGFGDEPRPAIRWRPDAYVAFLRYVLTEVVIEE